MNLYINHCSLHGLAHESDSGPHALRTKRRTHKDTLDGLEHVYQYTYFKINQGLDPPSPSFLSPNHTSKA